MSSSPLSGVTDTVTDVLTKNAAALQDLASSAAGLATNMAVAAVEQLEDLPERVVGLASAAKGHIVPPPRRSFKPWVLVAAAIATFAIVAWFLARRRSAAPVVDNHFDGGRDPVRSTTDTATSVVGV